MLREFARREIRLERQLDQVVQHARHRAGAVPRPAQPAGRSPGQRLRRRSEQPTDPSVRCRHDRQWTLCIWQGQTQYLYTTDEEPGRLYKLTLDGKILGSWGESGRQQGQLNWAHGLACRSDDAIYVADMNNWRVVKLVPQDGGSTTR